MRAVLEIFSSVFSYCKKKVTISENITFADSVSRIRPQDCSKLAKNPKNDNDVTIFWHDVIVKFFGVLLFLLSILVTGPSFMSISWLVLELWQFSFIWDWPEIRKSEILPSEFYIWRLGRVVDTKFGRNVSNGMLLNAAKFQDYSFYCFWVIKGKPTGRGLKLPPSPRLGSMRIKN